MNVPFRAILLASLFAIRTAAAQTYTTFHDFSSGAGHPQAPLVQAADGSLWGTTFDGGVYGSGSIFSLTPDGVGGFTYAERYAFTDAPDGARGPTAGLVQASDGKMYGVTPGSQTDIGTIFRIDADGNNFQTVHFFTNEEGSSPPSALIEGSDGRLYGVAQSGGASNFGTLFAFDPSNANLTVLHAFDQANGSGPYGSLLEGADGRLYGTTGGGGSFFAGVVFVIEKSGTNFEMLLDFNSTNGRTPVSALIQLADGFLYGTTVSAGNEGGMVFKIDTQGDNFQQLHAMQAGEGKYLFGGLVLAADGLLYGTSRNTEVDFDGTIYRLDSNGGNFEVVHTFTAAEGHEPLASLTRTADDSLIGTTSAAGDGGNGSVFEVDPATGGVTVLHTFASPDAFNSMASLVFGPGGFLYGTSMQGGPHGAGAVFKIDPAGTAYSILHGFGGTDGSFPGSTLTIGSDGKLYGTTLRGGGSDSGTIFRVDPDGGNFEVVHAFSLADGNEPYGVIQASDGMLYGGTLTGGQSSGGVLYRLDTDGQNFEILHEFPTGGPHAPLLQAADGKLYGTTFYGGAQNFGTIFRLDPDGANFEVIHEFAQYDGRWPTAGLVQTASGKLYGTTSQGGTTTWDSGVVFELDPSGSNFKVLHRFAILDGNYAYAGLLVGADGYLYGTTVIGTIYRINPVATPAFSNVWGSNFARLHVFDFFHGAAPFGGLVQGEDGSLYGTTAQGGAFFGGVVYKLELAPLRGSRPRTVTHR